MWSITFKGLPNLLIPEGRGGVTGEGSPGPRVEGSEGYRGVEETVRRNECKVSTIIISINLDRSWRNRDPYLPTNKGWEGIRFRITGLDLHWFSQRDLGGRTP